VPCRRPDWLRLFSPHVSCPAGWRESEREGKKPSPRQNRRKLSGETENYFAWNVCLSLSLEVLRAMNRDVTNAPPSAARRTFAASRWDGTCARRWSVAVAAPPGRHHLGGSSVGLHWRRARPSAAASSRNAARAIFLPQSSSSRDTTSSKGDICPATSIKLARRICFPLETNLSVAQFFLLACLVLFTGTRTSPGEKSRQHGNATREKKTKCNLAILAAACPNPGRPARWARAPGNPGRIECTFASAALLTLVVVALAWREIING
jgi:hypothetical protein